jgi:tetratricopeptide (TPR) repeat protein
MTAASAQGAWHQYLQSATKLFESGDYTQAEVDCRKAMKEMPADDPRYALSLLQLGKIYLAQKQADKASRALAYGMDLCRERRPMDLNLYCDLLTEQVAAYKAMNRLDLAKIAEQQLSFIPPKPLPAAKPLPTSPASSQPAQSSPEWKQLRAALSDCYREQRIADAEPLLKRYLALMEEQCGKDSPLLAPIMVQYSRVLQYVGKTAEADQYQQLASAVAPAKTEPVEASSVSSEDALADLDKRFRAMLKEQREREKHEIAARAEEEERIAAAREREHTQQLNATLQFEETQLAAHLEREKAAMTATRPVVFLDPDLGVLARQRAAAEAHTMPVTPGSIPGAIPPGSTAGASPGAAGTAAASQPTRSFTSPAVFSSPGSGVSIGGLGFSASVGNASK